MFFYQGRRFQRHKLLFDAQHLMHSIVPIWKLKVKKISLIFLRIAIGLKSACQTPLSRQRRGDGSYTPNSVFWYTQNAYPRYHTIQTQNVAICGMGCSNCFAVLNKSKKKEGNEDILIAKRRNSESNVQ